MDRRSLLRAALAGATLLALVACGGREGVRVRLATTTSFRDTGFADVLLPAFHAATGISVDAVAVGTGEALKLGERGDADVVLVHARKAEDAFMAKGFGVERQDVWWNRFVLLGPPEDPAGIAKATGARDALRRIREAKALFVSRGDSSGTHTREKELWGGDPRTPEYLETGQGQGPTLTIADERRGYTLSDEGTYLKMRAQIALRPLFAGDAALRNPYGAILVRARPGADDVFAASRRFVEWLAGPAARALVRDFRVDGERPFYLPDEQAPVPAGAPR